MHVSQKEIDRIYEWIDDENTPECGKDGWFPSYEDLHEAIFPAYNQAKKTQTRKGQKLAKRIVAFIYWLSEAPKGYLDKATEDSIKKFIEQIEKGAEKCTSTQ